MTLLQRPDFRAVCLWGVLALATFARPVLAANAEDDGPDVTIIATELRTIYEYRQNGHLRMIRIVPNIGRPYYLVPRDPTKGYGELDQADMLIPSWVLVEF